MAGGAEAEGGCISVEFAAGGAENVHACILL